MAEFGDDFEIEGEEPEVNEEIQFNLRYNQLSDYDNLEGGYEPPSVVPEQIPDVIRNFILLLYRQIKDQNVYEIQISYENFYKLSEIYYSNRTWPSPEEMLNLVGEDLLFSFLYKELYYRHIYSRRACLTLEHRFDSWKNYCDFFDYILAADVRAEIELPNQWIWDIVDEFIYQFQSFCQFRSKSKNIKDALPVLKENPSVWNVHTVLNYIHSIISKSNIIRYLENEKKEPAGNQRSFAASESQQDPNDFSSHAFFRMIGYFSLISLCRVHCLLGDYYLALKTLDPIDLNRKGLFTRVSICYISLYYYMGFSYLMVKRYADAVRTFTTILLYINRTKQYHCRSCQWEQIYKKNEYLFALLAIAVSLCPQRIDENIHSLLREKYSEKMAKFQRGFDKEEAQLAFEELFSYACPKFINPAPPNYDDLSPVGYQQEALKLQMKVFLNEVSQQAMLPTIRSYLKLYTTIGTQKLADFLEMEENDVKTQLLCYKHKNRTQIWDGGAAISGKWGSSSDIDFHVEQDMAHIADTKISKRYGEFFIRHINRFEEIIKDLREWRILSK
eukprot:TRINITY_DN478_c0_g1_i2.p1 TRINITY_DN478_c0_g1~~TRINITY_DN478_c0_g1_i2.p1  ORF type:complete len:575 (-),score=214.50 TRINITY_DN478_c0_g1_i2:61-1737(-)